MKKERIVDMKLSVDEQMVYQNAISNNGLVVPYDNENLFQAVLSLYHKKLLRIDFKKDRVYLK